MNNQFATQHLLQENEEIDIVAVLQQAGASEEAAKMLATGVRKGLIQLSRAIEIVKQTTGVRETSAVGGGVTGGPTAATFTAGTGEQVATTKAFKKKQYQEDAPRLAGNPAKTSKQGTKNLTAYTSAGFQKAPNAEEAGKHIKGVEVKDLWEELYESRAYSKFKKETAVRSKGQQMHEAIKTVHKKLEEVNRLLEFTNQMRQELSEGEGAVEYSGNTKKIFEKINRRIVDIYTKAKHLK